MKKVISWLWAMSVTLPLFAEGNELPPERDQGMWQTIIMFGMFFVFFYFIMLRPEQKRRKAMADVRDHLKKGDRVVAMGIIGTVLRVQDNTVILKMYDGAKLEVLKEAISEVRPEGEKETAALEKGEE
jgi:preprotein translocase subunit YajC